jgi:hypothetical protein
MEDDLSPLPHLDAVIYLQDNDRPIQVGGSFNAVAAIIDAHPEASGISVLLNGCVGTANRHQDDPRPLWLLIALTRAARQMEPRRFEVAVPPQVAL